MSSSRAVWNRDDDLLNSEVQLVVRDGSVQMSEASCDEPLLLRASSERV